MFSRYTVERDRFMDISFVGYPFFYAPAAPTVTLR